jgi:hypothetical protein
MNNGQPVCCYYYSSVAGGGRRGVFVIAVVFCRGFFESTSIQIAAYFHPVRSSVLIIVVAAPDQLYYRVNRDSFTPNLSFADRTKDKTSEATSG